MTARYDSVRDMVHDLSDADFAKSFDDYQLKRKLVNYLVVNRGLAGITEAEMARDINVSVEVLQRMESGTDAELPFFPTLFYLDALLGINDSVDSVLRPWLSTND